MGGFARVFLFHSKSLTMAAGSCRGWRHLVALHEATDALHWAMHLALHHRIRMAIKIASF
jgi:hypothetical protein